MNKSVKTRNVFGLELEQSRVNINALIVIAAGRACRCARDRVLGVSRRAVAAIVAIISNGRAFMRHVMTVVTTVLGNRISGFRQLHGHEAWLRVDVQPGKCEQRKHETFLARYKHLIFS